MNTYVLVLGFSVLVGLIAHAFLRRSRAKEKVKNRIDSLKEIA